MDFLVPTEIKSADDSKNLGIKVDYPASQIMDTPLGKIAVYSGKTEIPFTIKEVKQNQKISLTAQACDGKTCYPPSTWDFTINPIPAPKEKQSTK
jgi:thiol:disulfide interchange protein